MNKGFCPELKRYFKVGGTPKFPERGGGGPVYGYFFNVYKGETTF